MPKNAPDLDQPFRRGEKVVTTRDIVGATEGTAGKVRLVNGLSDYNGGSPWLRYWVRFSDGSMIGQVDHNDLVRPAQVEAWHERQAARAEQALRAEEAVEEAPAAIEGGGDGGVASQIPAHLLERSKAAKARLLGG